MSKQNYFVSDRTTDKTIWNLRVIGYDTVLYKIYQPLYPKFTSNNLSVYILIQPLPGYCLCSNSAHRQVKSSFHNHLSVIVPSKRGDFFNKKYTSMAYQSQYDKIVAVKHWQQLENKVS